VLPPADDSGDAAYALQLHRRLNGGASRSRQETLTSLEDSDAALAWRLQQELNAEEGDIVLLSPSDSDDEGTTQLCAVCHTRPADKSSLHFSRSASWKELAIKSRLQAHSLQQFCHCPSASAPQNSFVAAAEGDAGCKSLFTYVAVPLCMHGIEPSCSLQPADLVLQSMLPGAEIGRGEDLVLFITCIPVPISLALPVELQPVLSSHLSFRLAGSQEL